MRKYAFRKGDVVRAQSVLLGYTRDGETVILPTDEESIVGRVIGFGSSAGHDWYKVASGGDVYNCRDDELELVRRGPAGREFPPIGEDELERFLLIWRPMSVDPPKDAECAVVWAEKIRKICRGDMLRWNGRGWIVDTGAGEFEVDRDSVAAWTLWEWPEIDGKEAGDHDTDPDDGQGRD